MNRRKFLTILGLAPFINRIDFNSKNGLLFGNIPIIVDKYMPDNSICFIDKKIFCGEFAANKLLWNIDKSKI